MITNPALSPEAALTIMCRFLQTRTSLLKIATLGQMRHHAASATHTGRYKLYRNQSSTCYSNSPNPKFSRICVPLKLGGRMDASVTLKCSNTVQTIRCEQITPRMKVSNEAVKKTDASRKPI